VADDLATRIGQEIRDRRKARGWKQADLAAKLAVSQAAVSRWESAQRVPDLVELAVLGSVFGASLADLVGAAEPPSAPLLTDAEHRAMELTCELYNLLCRQVIGDAESRSGDVRELVGHVHAVQHMILSQAAARAYPDRYRLLGETLKETNGGE
jgi:transcriptional regulator with XRE-family HTH domain